jgi:hypothetical protein
MNPAGVPFPYMVSFAAGLLDLIREWGGEALEFGVALEYTTALREVERELGTRPREWGDPLFDYHKLALTACQRYTPVFVIRYLVHQTQPVVFVREVVLTPGSLLRDLLG